MAAAATSSRRRALISVSDKQGLLEFARGLVALDFEIVSTGGTRRFLLESGLPVTDISEYTGFPEMLDGRVKTLHPKVHGGLLGRPHLPADAQAMQAHGILPFALVAVNLYPFEATVARPDCPFHDAIENIDIGGPSMIRSAAKNHELVAIVTSPAQYAPVLEAFRAGELPLTLRRQLAAAAYETTARYDRAIANWFQGTLHPDEAFPRTFSPVFERVGEQLRYGENPQQAAAFYTEVRPAAGTLATTRQLHGKELSYNNLLDLDAALQLVREFDEPAAVVLKHNNPCGAAVATTLATAFDRAYAGDPVSAFGSILGFNRPVDLETALLLCVPDRFVEAIVAPGYTPEAFEA
ncbi:MAG: bifunctional phosphoribosylaminoimidazolecarboxamide formyltransferase/IMP cyclohydrolase, partial [Planctomycetaceae bacterium]